MSKYDKLRKGKGTRVTKKYLLRERPSMDGGVVLVKVRRGEDGTVKLTRRLAKLLLNKDWGED